MRPTRLELEGFTSFRDKVVVEFDGADYFALVGPTGSGKSSIIDAVCFALYGSVPRYEDKRLVAPVISQGKLEAKVSLEFTVNGDSYTAVRVVRRGKKGASVKEARLVRAGADQPLAGTGPEVTARVTELLGLTFEHFTKCVVLPQGEFARFLHDDPKDRQEFLVRLLNLGLYETMQRAANARAASAKERRAMLEERLGELEAAASPQAIAEAKRKLRSLSELRDQVAEAEPALRAFNDQREAATAAAADAARWLDLIDGLRIPQETGTLNDEMAAARKLVVEATETVKDKRAAAKKADDALAALPERPPLDAALTAHRERDGLVDRIAAAVETVERSAEAAAQSQRALKEAEAAEVQAATALEQARMRHHAHHLSSALEVGASCPVCRQAVTTLPAREAPADLQKAQDEAERRRAEVVRRRDIASHYGNQLAAAQKALEERKDEDERLLQRIGEHSDRARLEAALATIDAAAKACVEARTAQSEALDRLDAARRTLDRLEDRVGAQRDAFAEARDSLAPLGPPKPKNDDLIADWEALLAWSRALVPDLQQRRNKAEAEAVEASKAGAALADKLARACARCGIEPTDGDVAIAVGEATRSVEQLEATAAELETKREQQRALDSEYEIAHQLGLHLSAKPGSFVSWIVNEALERLVEGATRILRALSDDQYALCVDDLGQFFVTDRHNADEQRSARTLSGGETFLASLSLALALADQLGELAAEGAARLDAIFLDEGFGTLDPETLDTVAATVENLAAGGRMVGVVTHVRELADRIPTQFRVKKALRSSTVERVEA